MQPYLRIECVTKKFGDFAAVDDVSLDIRQGEVFCLLGASGCGKTTLLRVLAGFESPTAGSVFIDGQDMSGVPPYERPVNMMFQSYALFPHLSVEQNVSFGLEQERLPRAEIRRRVAEMLEIVRMRPYAKRKPQQLSGGQGQRVALARALVKRPKLLLLDEPLAALDKKLREHTQFELTHIQEQLGVTFVVVTHDQEEAMTLASRIGVMNHGKIVQVGTPAEIYEFPNSRFVADFIGSVNLFEGRVIANEPDGVRIESQELGGTICIDNGAARAAAGAVVWVALRPEKIAIARKPTPLLQGQGPDDGVRGIVKDVAYMGDMSVYRVQLANGKLLRITRQNVIRHAEEHIARDEQVYLHWHPSSGVVITQ
jgi:putrescine transport system ATP-binding protein